MAAATIRECLATLGVTAADFAGCSSTDDEFAAIRRRYFKAVLVGRAGLGRAALGRAGPLWAGLGLRRPALGAWPRRALGARATPAAAARC
jgi:hypothetical protein